MKWSHSLEMTSSLHISTTGWTVCSAHASILGPCMYPNQGKWYKSSYLKMRTFLLRLFDYVYLTSKVNKKNFDLFPLWYSNPFKNGIFSKMEPMLSRGVETTLLIKMSLFIMQIKVVSIEKVEKTGVFEVTFCDLRPRRARIDHVCTTNDSPCRT